MHTSSIASIGPAVLSPVAERLLRCFRSADVRWAVLTHACSLELADVPCEEVARAVSELEDADLVERAPHGPLLYIR